MHCNTMLDEVEHFALDVRLDIVLSKPKETSGENSDHDLLWFLVESIVAGKSDDIFTDPRVKEILSCSSSTNVFDDIRERVCSYVKCGDRCRHVIALLIGISTLKLFIRSNWTGPALKDRVEEQLFANVENESEFFDCCVKALEVGGEPAYHLVSNPALLVLANILLVEARAFSSAQTASLWACRCAYIHQLVLLERCSGLYCLIKENLEWLETQKFFQEGPATGMQFLMEAAMYHLHYFEVTKAQSYLDRAKQLCHAEFELTGALGKRTYHQQTSLPQLILSTRRCGDVIGSSTEQHCPLRELPKDVTLKDDTIMNEIKFSDELPVECTLTAEEQCLILAMCMFKKSIGSPEPLRDEEMTAYIAKITSDPKVWSVHFSALFHRSRLESKNSRRVERAMSQLQCLVDAVKSEVPTAEQRQRLFFCTALPATWNVEKELGHLFFTLGATKSALDLFLKYELWEEVVVCYIQVGRRDRAEAVVRERLQVEETALLYCLLGDATDEPAHYLKAWEASGEKSARAQRSLGMHYYRKKEYERAIPHLEKSLEINSLQMAAWFSLGYAALQAQNFELSVKAYKRVVNIDPDNYEAWNNMANAYIRMGDKQKAWKVLKESLKCNYEDWRVWENYLLVSVDVGAFEECIHAWHRMIDIKGKHADSKVARILVRAVLEDVVGMTGSSARSLRKKLSELFSRVTSGITNDADMWHCYGALYAIPDKDGVKEEDVEKMLQYYQKSHRCLTHKPKWERDLESCCEVLEKSREIVEACVSGTKDMADATKRQQLLSTVRITIRGTLSVVKAFERNYVPDQMEQIGPLVELVDAKLDELALMLA
ncbi:tetratricopeptide repeat protein 27-like [Ornithodoros turicata]|uniref:tetratricopeptide repeat protein 27-like n=1 Tax=Ornithodoros turicata TaxID=34597 RepID=UPI00313A1BD4